MGKVRELAAISQSKQWYFSRVVGPGGFEPPTKQLTPLGLEQPRVTTNPRTVLDRSLAPRRCILAGCPGLTEPVARYRRDHFTTDDTETPNRKATARQPSPPRYRRNNPSADRLKVL
jgi:hypothetical protein